MHGNLRQKCQTQLSEHHSQAGFDCFHFEDDVRQHAYAAKEAVHEGPIAGAAVVGDQGQRFQFFEAYVSFCHCRMTRMAHEHQGIIAQADGFHLRMMKGAGETKIHFAVQDHFQNLGGIAAAHADHHVRMGDLVFFQNFRKQIRANGKRSGDRQGAARGRAQFAYRLAGQRYLAQQLFGMRTQGFASLGKREACRAAVEEAGTKRVFESLDPGANGGLADVQHRGRAMKTTIARNCQKSFELHDLHGCLIFPGERTGSVPDVPIIIFYRYDNDNPFD